MEIQLVTIAWCTLMGVVAVVASELARRNRDTRRVRVPVRSEWDTESGK